MVSNRPSQKAVGGWSRRMGTSQVNNNGQSKVVTLNQHCNNDYPNLVTSPEIIQNVPNSEFSEVVFTSVPNPSENFHPEGLL
jgi:hypothetical protein